MFKDAEEYTDNLIRNYGKMKRIILSGKYDLGQTGITILQESILPYSQLDFDERFDIVYELQEELSNLDSHIRKRGLLRPLRARRQLRRIDKTIGELDDCNKKRKMELNSPDFD